MRNRRCTREEKIVFIKRCPACYLLCIRIRFFFLLFLSSLFRFCAPLRAVIVVYYFCVPSLWRSCSLDFYIGLDVRGPPTRIYTRNGYFYTVLACACRWRVRDYKKKEKKIRNREREISYRVDYSKRVHFTLIVE